jgi:hypothetical protein
MTIPTAVELTKNPTTLLHDQVTALQEIQESLRTISENLLRILESLSGLKAYNERLYDEEVTVAIAILICRSDR